MIRQIATRLTRASVATVRLASALPVWVANTVLDRLSQQGEPGPANLQPPQREPEEQAEPTARKASDTSTDAPMPSETRPRSGTARAGVSGPEDQAPDLVLAVDTPPEEIGPPTDVVGEALAEEEAKAAERPHEPEPKHIDDGSEVVYSTSSDDETKP